MAWFWGTPMCTRSGRSPANWPSTPHLLRPKYVYLSNPITPIVMTFQRVIYGQTQSTFEATTHLLPTPGGNL